MSMCTPLRFLCLGVSGALLVACQQERAAQRPDPAATAPALADTLALDSVADPIGATPVRRDWHRLERPTSRLAPLVVYRGSTRRPAGIGAEAPPAEARLQDLTLKASEYFQIDPTKAAEVRGREGTVVRIPAGALVDARQRPATGTVWVELKECYAASDMLLSNLLTETLAGAPLELTGAVLVRATAAGQQLMLAAGRSLQLELAGRRGDSHSLFYGKATGSATPVRWLEGEASAAPTEQVYTTAQQMPRFGQGPADINQLIRYPRQAQERQTQGLVFASFVVDEAGRVQSPRILRGIGDGCDEEVLRVLRQTSGRWTPGQQDGRFVKVKMVLPIRFNFQAGLASAPDPNAVPEPVAASVPVPEPQELAPAPNALQPTRLGWLAVGQPWAGAAAALYVPAATPTDGEHTAVRLLVPGRRVVLAGTPQAAGYHFASAPSGSAVVVLGLRYENGTPFLARREATTSAPSDTLRFQETTLTDLEANLARLN
ncbi:TonB family protein [Hymenobacter luteus]|uniref:TonB family protein n=3 Tax=Hymenobacter TaxID=89966 RepID=A0A7W9T463_9BACT|nr:energy transducer TonB [Hymenobacter luteus]MBB4603211.1 TonB family protein [Hymenobacter latericoloratus]MBB6060109.1 TonB family protein [Hymenobacter luteus]